MWLFGGNKKPCFESWPIVRSKPSGKAYGRSISLFINNLQCHLTTVDVYEDGSIDCWGFVDRALFEAKLNARWVVSQPKNDQLLSVFHFGIARTLGGAWLQTQSAIAKEIDTAIQSMNPEMSNLIDMQGSDVEIRGNIRTAKMGLSDKKAYRIAESTGEEVLADNVAILRPTSGSFELTRLFVFADGLLRIGSNGDLFSIEELPARYAAGEVGNQAPAGSLIRLPGLGEFRSADTFGGVSIEDRIGEVRDLLHRLKGGTSVIRLCAQLFENYIQEPSPTTKDALRAAYEAVPEHLRIYCGDMDTRDTAIRKVLYG